MCPQKNDEQNRMSQNFQLPQITFLRAAALTVVFVVFFTIPIVIFNNLKESANNLLIQKDLETIRNWAEIQKIKKGNYSGLANDIEIIRKKIDIKVLGGELELYINLKKNNYCAKSKFSGSKKKQTWCVDSTGYSGPTLNGCTSEIDSLCREIKANK